jgi:hypothetical protein
MVAGRRLACGAKFNNGLRASTDTTQWQRFCSAR